MASTTVIRPVGQTYMISVGAAQTSDIVVKPSTNDICNYASFINSGAVDVCVTMSPNGINTTTITFPAAGAPSGGITHILRANAVAQPLILAVPASGPSGAGFQVSAIGAGAGPSSIFITPVGDQS